MSTIEIDVNLPVDSSFTNMIVYEGLAYLLNNINAEIINNTIRVDLNDVRHVYRNLEEERLKKIRRLQIVGNDLKVVQRFIQQLGITQHNGRITNYGDILILIRENSDNILSDVESIPLRLSISRRDKCIFVGDINNRRNGVSFQLFKTERYTGITSTEYDYSTKQLTTYFSRDTMLIALLGVYSSFITRVSENRSTYYFFLFLGPEEIIDILSGNKDARILFLIKDHIRNVFEELIAKQFSEELLITEIVISARIQEFLHKHNISGMSMLLVKLAQEGQTYKIYEYIPLTVYRRTELEPYKILDEILSSDSIVLERLRKRDNVEYNNLILAIVGLYRYVVLGDKQGMLTMIRELHNAYTKVKADEKLKKYANQYERMLKDLSHVARLL
ncbi:MAG: hypothetical protein B9J98_04140 [Candidatus Terraquivivens tikiterensis]|uniref:Uncharacterized protein n=1 Tax=Candidatus Terraquivivens tikiterensis TaxID=1980982 RepID=A0A2R7Y558_9ARCH|nr:MAG: hypothetical protein B9J98_04140 [Candidatus Terraquivivens tikiterensis]